MVFGPNCSLMRVDDLGLEKDEGQTGQCVGINGWVVKDWFYNRKGVR
jgi:hypothetical protein